MIETMVLGYFIGMRGISGGMDWCGVSGGKAELGSGCCADRRG